MDTSEARHEIVSLVLRDFALRRLPFALYLSERSRAGEVLDDDEAESLDAMLRDVTSANSAVSDHADLQRLRDCVTRLHRLVRAQSAFNANADDAESAAVTATSVPLAGSTDFAARWR